MQPIFLASSRDLALSFQGGKPQDVYFHLQLELLDLDIIKAFNKMIFANRAVYWLLNLPSMTHGLSSLVSTQVGKETAEKTSPKRKT